VPLSKFCANDVEKIASFRRNSEDTFQSVAQATFFVLLPGPIASASSQDAIDLLSGHKSHVPDSITWTVLIIGAYITQYRIFKFLSTL